MNRTLLIGVVALLAGGCAPKFLVHTYFIPDTAKVVRESVQYGGSTDGGGADLVNFYLQVCDLNDGVATNCKSTMVLQNVVSVNFYSTGY